MSACSSPLFAPAAKQRHQSIESKQSLQDHLIQDASHDSSLAPSVSDYTPLSEYQSQIPETFHGGKPVLHYHATGVLARVSRSQCDSLAFFSNPSPLSFPEPSVDNQDEKYEQLVDLFINSENFTVYSPKASCGLSLPYPTITFHAIKKVQNTAVEGEEFPSVNAPLQVFCCRP